MVDVGFLSVSSAADIPIEPLYKDPLLCVVQKGRRTSKEPMSIEEMKTASLLHSVKVQMPTFRIL